MRKIIAVLLLTSIVLLSFSSVALAKYMVIANYPKSVYWGQSFTIIFSLATSIINSTNFQYVTPGTKILEIDNYTAYQGFGGYWVVDKVNITDASTLIVSLEGEVIGKVSVNPGIVLYSSNLSLTSKGGQTGTYAILTAWSGSLWLYKLDYWYQALSTITTYTSGNYTVVFTKTENNTVCVYSITVNGSTYLIKYDTGIAWDSIGYVGIMLDYSTILPIKFYVVANIPAHYVVYVNGKKYTSGYGSVGNMTLKLYSPAIINITYPAYGVYKVITVSTSDDANIKQQFPIIQITLIVVTSLLIGVSIWREIIKRK